MGGYRRDAYDDMGDFIADEDEDDLNEVMDERNQARYDEDRGRRGKASKDMMHILPAGISEE